ncbi:MAG: hypothetical protein OQL19_13545 [Gammaproteobacteria bacterium]|nr:hypothetical protein [Gammaproteobacteria bacterium]
MSDNTLQTIGKLGLENLMSRANIIFTSGYKFSGQLNTDNLYKSFISVLDQIVKFEYQIHHQSQSDYQWKKSGPFKNRFLTIKTDDIDEEFKNICSRSFDLLKEANHYPMLLAVIEPVITKDAEENVFIIAQLSEHAHCDAGSSELIFNKVIEHYNALESDDHTSAQKILEGIKDLITLDSEDMIELLKQEHFNHQDNVDNLMQYPVADVGEYRLPPDTIAHHLEEYKKRIRKPIIQYFDIQLALEKCRKVYPEITKNSIVCALLAKGIYKLNVSLKNKPKEHIISFKMVSNILPKDLRDKYFGNYISFIPVSVDGHLSVEDIAYSINERIKEFKSTQLNLSIFSLVEDAVKASEVGSVDEEMSFIVTNWNNYTFLNNPDYLSGCQSIKHISGVNIEPKDTLGALLVNRPVLVINLSPDEELCLSYFPSLRSDDETLQIAESMEKAFADI